MYLIPENNCGNSCSSEFFFLYLSIYKNKGYDKFKFKRDQRAKLFKDS